MARTLRSTVSIAGAGLFTGAPVVMTIAPARAGEGIGFTIGGERVLAVIANLATTPLIPAFARLPARHTCLAARAGRQMATVEHVMSALAGLGITDATIACRDAQNVEDRPEVPILDGSAAGFVAAMLRVGIEETGSQTWEPITLRETIRIEREDASIVVTPRASSEGPDGPTYTYNLAYPAPIGVQTARWSGDGDRYVSEIAPARTFSLEHEARMMQSMGLFRDLTPRDMLVIGADGPIDNALRFPDEPARHKVLDLIGDLALAGPGMSRLRADVVATRSGHALAHEAARILAPLLA